MFDKTGILNGSVDTVEIANKLIKRECSNVIVGVNKKSTFAHPDMKDFELARLLCRKLNSIGIKMIDYIIIGSKVSFSIIFDGTFSY